MTTRAFAAGFVLLAAATVSAQQYKSLTVVALFKVLPGKDGAFAEKGAAFGPVFDKLMAYGTVLAYGLDVDILHVPGETNAAFWATVPNYAALEKEQTAIDEFRKSNPGVMAELMSMTDPAAHRDLIVRAREEGHRAIPPGAKPVTDFDMVRVKPDRMQEFMGLFQKYDKPVLEKLVAGGVIYAYELDTEAVHTMEPGMTWTVITMPDLATKDKVSAAFDDAQKSIPEEERNKLEKAYYDMVVAGSHRDSLAHSVIFKQK